MIPSGGIGNPARRLLPRYRSFAAGVHLPGAALPVAGACRKRRGRPFSGERCSARSFPSWRPTGYSTRSISTTRFLFIVSLLFMAGALVLPSALVYGAFAALYRYFFRDNIFFHGLMVPSLWVLFEFAREFIPLYLPWALDGYSLAGFPVLIQIADTVGVYGLSFLLVAVNSLVTAALLRWNAAGISFKAIRSTPCANRCGTLCRKPGLPSWQSRSSSYRCSSMGSSGWDNGRAGWMERLGPESSRHGLSRETSPRGTAGTHATCMRYWKATLRSWGT